MAKGDFGFLQGSKLDPRLQQSLPLQSIRNFVVEVKRQLRAGLISPEAADDAVRKLRAEFVSHKLEHGGTAEWLALTPAQRDAEIDATRGLSNTRESDEAIEARQQLALDRVAGNAAYRLTDEGTVSPQGYTEFWRAKAPEPYRALRKRIGLAQELGIDGELRPLSEAEHLKLARALAKLDRGEEVEAEAPPPEPARPGPPSYPKGRDQWSDTNMEVYIARRNKEDAEAKRRENYEDGPDEEADEQPTEL